MANLNAVLWDLDGVLVDTGEFHFQAWMETLRAAGIPYSRELFRKTFGMNNMGTLTHLLGRAPDPELATTIANRKETAFRAAVRGQVQPLPGVRDWVPRLHAAGWKQAVASSAPLENVQTLIAELKLDPYFDALVSAENLPSKPDPAVFLWAAERVGVPPERCIVVEDAVMGVAGAKRAGMKCLAVTTTNPTEALREADWVIENLAALPADGFIRLLSPTT